MAGAWVRWPSFALSMRLSCAWRLRRAVVPSGAVLSATVLSATVLSATVLSATVLASLVVGAGLVGCGGAGQSDATKNRTFYDWSLGDGSQAFEKPYPRLDWPEKTASSRFIGVSILQDQVYFSRPRNWRVRNASNRPDEPYIHYVSPNAYSFAIYQRRDPPGDPWKDIVDRYTKDAEDVGAKIIGRLVPMATSNGQGRAFTVERDVEAAKRPLQSRSREIVLRSGKMVVLVQIVHQERNLEAVDDELLRAVATIHLP